MGQLERLQKLQRWLGAGRCLQRDSLMADLGISRATLNRDLAYLRDRTHLPLVWDAARAGWRLQREDEARQKQFELPGLWFSAEEVHALLTMQHLLSNLDAGGLLGPQIEPLATRLGQILGTGVPPQAELARRIHVKTVGARRIQLPHFQALASATLRRKRLDLGYQSRSRNQHSQREVSPQRLVHYRDNWYLDAWCHSRAALRSFSVDAVLAVQVLDSAAHEVPAAELDAALGVGYGIFKGEAVRWARLRFSAHRARWVAAERWHADQQGRWDEAGRWLLDVPYADPRELVMDILRHVPDVEVIAPAELQAEVARRLREGLVVIAAAGD